MDLNVAIHILSFNRHQQRSKPFKRPKVSTHPEEVHLSEAGLLPRIVHPVPDALEDRSKRGNTDSGSNKNGDFVLKYVFRSTSKRTINIHPW